MPGVLRSDPATGLACLDPEHVAACEMCKAAIQAALPPPPRTRRASKKNARRR